MRGVVAAYEPISIGRVRLGVGADTDRTFEFILPRPEARDFPAIVTFLLVSSNDLHMRIELNGTVISDRRYTNGAERSIQEVADGISVAVGNRNTMTFTVLQGEVFFSDLVLWYQRSVKPGDIIGSGFDIDIGIQAAIGGGLFADYKVIKIGRVRLSVGADTDRTFEFELPGLAEPLLSPGIVTFLLVSSNDLHMRIELNGTVISDRRYTNGAERAIQEIADGTSVFVSANNRNTMTFSVLQGEVLLRDVVLWFSRGT